MIKSGYFPYNHARIYYEVAGENTKDHSAVVFAHAGVADRRMWDDQFEVFAREYRCVRYDRRGFGKTEDDGGAAEVASRDDLYALLKFLEIDHAILIGCSMGGGTCMDVALEHPEIAAALVMVGSGPNGLELDVPMDPKDLEAEAAFEAKNWPQYLELSAQVWLDGKGRTPDQVDPQKRALMIDMMRGNIDLIPKVEATAKAPLQPSAGERLDQLKIPVLIVYGDRDIPYILATSQFMADHIKGAKKVLIPGTAHLPSMDVPEQFNQIVLEFLHQVQ